eukprot:SAG31_NODE_1675_length_7552_cov_69.287228_7_plen_286_part_00
MFDYTSKYIVTQLHHHVKSSLCKENGQWVVDEIVCSWLDDYNMVQDAVPLACAKVFGSAKIEELAMLAIEQGKFWSAALRWSVAALSAADLQTGGEHFKQCATSLLSMDPKNTAMQRAKDRLELSTVLAILSMWNPLDLPTYMPRLHQVRTTDIAKEDDESIAQAIHCLEYYLYFFAEHCGDGKNMVLFAKGGIKHIHALKEPALAFPKGHFRRTLFLAEGLGFSAGFLTVLILYGHCTWESLCGEDGNLLVELSENYDYDTMHHRGANNSVLLSICYAIAKLIT